MLKRGSWRRRNRSSRGADLCRRSLRHTVHCARSSVSLIWSRELLARNRVRGYPFRSYHRTWSFRALRDGRDYRARRSGRGFHCVALDLTGGLHLLRSHGQARTYFFVLKSYRAFGSGAVPSPSAYNRVMNGRRLEASKCRMGPHFYVTVPLSCSSSRQFGRGLFVQRLRTGRRAVERRRLCRYIFLFGEIGSSGFGQA